MKKFKCDVESSEHIDVYIDYLDWDCKKGDYIHLEFKSSRNNDQCICLTKKKALKLVEELNKLIDRLEK